MHFVRTFVAAVVGMAGAEVFLLSATGSQGVRSAGILLIIVSTAILAIDSRSLQSVAFPITGCILITTYVLIRARHFPGLIKDEDLSSLSTTVDLAFRVFTPLMLVSLAEGQAYRIAGRILHRGTM